MAGPMSELTRRFRTRRVSRRTSSSTAPFPPLEMAASQDSDTVAPESVDMGVDRGWGPSRVPGRDGFEGWLYHYADRAMVSEDGTVHAYSRSGSAVPVHQRFACYAQRSCLRQRPPC